VDESGEGQSAASGPSHFKVRCVPMRDPAWGCPINQLYSSRDRCQRFVASLSHSLFLKFHKSRPTNNYTSSSSPRTPQHVEYLLQNIPFS